MVVVDVITVDNGMVDTRKAFSEGYNPKSRYQFLGVLIATFLDGDTQKYVVPTVHCSRASGPATANQQTNNNNNNNNTNVSLMCIGCLSMLCRGGRKKKHSLFISYHAEETTICCSYLIIFSHMTMVSPLLH